MSTYAMTRSFLFNRNLVRKHLVDNPGRPNLSAQAMNLFHSIVQGVSLSTEWRVTDPEKDETTGSMLEHATITSATARTSMMVTAACNIVVTVTGQKAKDEAKDFLAKKE